MKADPLSLFEEFIKGAVGSQYVIPVYQRNYTWKKHKQAQQLLEDIKKILKHETSRHFLGSIVYVITKTDFIVREREVVDGQQRLVTMFLITYALKEIASDNGDTQISDYLVHNYLENNETGEYKYRLRPSVSDDDAYLYIATDRVSEYEGSSIIMENYKYIKSALAGLVASHTLMEVINAIRNLYIVRIELESGDDAQQIFESINSTGEKLTPADLIRNFIMMNRNNTDQEHIYHSYWLKLEKIFPESKKLSELPVINNGKSNRSYNKDGALLLQEIRGDILYIDPPYNERQYLPNYHVLETATKYDFPVLRGVTGQRPYEMQRSDFCSKKTVVPAFDALLANAKFKHIILSYNTDGIMALEEIEATMKKHGIPATYEVNFIPYRRFKSRSIATRTEDLKEMLIYIQKEV